MFYIKGDSFLLSFSKHPLLPLQEQKQQGEEGEALQYLDQHRQDLSSTIIHYFWGCFDMLPKFLFAASTMCIIAYLCSVLLIPTVMTATIANLKNDPNSTVFNGTAEVPLDIKCPFLSPRTSPPQNVHDLRPDDFRIVMGLGDRYVVLFASGYTSSANVIKV